MLFCVINGKTQFHTFPCTSYYHIAICRPTWLYAAMVTITTVLIRPTTSKSVMTLVPSHL